METFKAKKRSFYEQLSQIQNVNNDFMRTIAALGEFGKLNKASNSKQTNQKQLVDRMANYVSTRKQIKVSSIQMQKQKELEDSIQQRRFISLGTKKILGSQTTRKPIYNRSDEINEAKLKRIQEIQSKIQKIRDAELTFKPKTNRTRSAMSYRSEDGQNNSLSLIKRQQLWNHRKQRKIEQLQAEREAKEKEQKQAVQNRLQVNKQTQMRNIDTIYNTNPKVERKVDLMTDLTFDSRQELFDFKKKVNLIHKTLETQPSF